ncbi:spore coat protein U-like protein [Stella humosa]|uniref:Spore coat protein U-like protein n=1 Tax=Stella humosa TaxID=94 RepID=A0A3N1M9Y3_9PROT|nr:spore coat U domain-containing protein [Stella humosa]ROP99854.1 spore coat protein U-like protein [Stella humosa]BBK30917.1 hypothetical protein STHU_15510 [Stella humosa]
MRIARILLLLAAFAAWSPPVKAASCLLLCTCTVVTTPVSFSDYNPINGPAVLNNGNVAVTCRVFLGLNIGLLVSYEIAISAGQSGSVAQRKMFKGGDSLNYNLYTSNSYGTIWGTSAPNTVVDGYALALVNTTKNHTVFGRIPAGQNTVPVGDYSDTTVVVTVTY